MQIRILAAGFVLALLVVDRSLGQQPATSPGSPDFPAASATTACGASIAGQVLTYKPVATTSTSLGPLRGSQKTLVVPEGLSYCVKVSISAEPTCGTTTAVGDGGHRSCMLRATIDGRELQPGPYPLTLLDDRHRYLFEWVARIGPGSHAFQIEWRVSHPDMTFELLRSVIDIQLRR